MNTKEELEKFEADWKNYRESISKNTSGLVFGGRFHLNQGRILTSESQDDKQSPGSSLQMAEQAMAIINSVKTRAKFELDLRSSLGLDIAAKPKCQVTFISQSNL